MAFPEKVLSTILESQEYYYYRRERIKKLKELVELREAGKTINSLVLTKGSLSSNISFLINQGKVENGEYIREILLEAIANLKALKNQLLDSSFSNLSLSAEAMHCLSVTIAAYEEISRIPNEQLIKLEILKEISRFLDLMMKSGREMINKLDDHRKILDNTYSHNNGDENDNT